MKSGSNDGCPINSASDLSAHPRIGILTGPTATGKTALALEAARLFPKLELINADSLLFYRGLDIGTAKPTLKEREQTPHHLIDVCDPSTSFTAGDFFRSANDVIADIHARKKRALIVGGSGFYLKALLYGLWDAPRATAEQRARVEAQDTETLYQRLYKVDSESALRISRNDRYRLVRAIELLELTGKTPTQLEAESPQTPDPRFELWVIDRANEELHQRISARTRLMIQSGLLDETRQLLSRYPESRTLSAVGYAQARAYLDGTTPPGRKPASGLAGLETEVELATRQLVKRQRTWFRGETSSQWFTLESDRDALIQRLRSMYE